MQRLIFNPCFRLFAFIPIFFLLSLLLACGDGQTQLERIIERQQLRVLTRISPVSYFPGGDSKQAFEQELSKQFADYLGVEAIFKLAHVGNIYPGLMREDVDVAAANLIKSDVDGFRFGPGYLTVTPVLVGHRRDRHPLSLNELLGQGSLTVPSGLGSDLIKAILPEGVSEIMFNLDSERDSEELLRKIAQESLAFTITTSNEFGRMQNFYPQLVDVLEIEAPALDLAWAFKKTGDDSLIKQSESFFQQIRLNGELDRLIDRFYGYTRGANYWNNLAFIERIEDRLPQFKQLFQQSGEKHGVDWRLLAAISYQESHWEEDASSYTGVRGLMMLTKDTATEMGVEDRTDPRQSIEGGTRYFLKIKEKFAPRITEPDRTWFAMAAYNVGYGHLEDARVLTESDGKNPDHWYQVKAYLPRLKQKEWYKKTRFGFARGEEPVQFVRNIRRFYDILSWFDNEQHDLRHVKRRLDRTPIDLPTL